MIRFVIGFLLVMGSVGGIDNAAPDESLVPMMIGAAVGLALMAWGQATGRAFGK